MTRFNPRMRYDKDATKVAGVQAPYWEDLVALADRHLAKPLKRDTPEEVAAYAAEDKAYRDEMMDINDSIRECVRRVREQSPHKWYTCRNVAMGWGRSNEVSLEVPSSVNFRSWLTCATLGLYDRSEGIPREKLVRFDKNMFICIDMLGKSADRRENTWDYRDKSIREILALPHKEHAIRQRCHKVISDIKFRKLLDKIFADMSEKRKA